MSQSEFAQWINPVLRALRELGGSARPHEVVELVAKNERVTDDVLDQLNPAGGQRFPNQVHWARYYLAEAGYIDRSRRGVWKLSDVGMQAGELTAKQVGDVVGGVQAAYRSSADSDSRSGSAPRVKEVHTEMLAPADDSRLAPEADDTDYRTKLLTILQSLPPEGFERLCQRLLREAGFEQVAVTGRSGDGGIDGHGVLGLNAFVSFRVLFQCKRYVGSVSPSHVRDFRGAMQGRADKGLILTTGSFSADARREASRDGAPPIELVDGEKLVTLFGQLELGLRSVTTYEVDEPFFNEYRSRAL
jgi:restriction system protein